MIFIGVGVVVILATVAWGILTYQFINQAAIAQGEVIKLNSGGSHPEIKFMTRDGKEIEYPQGTGNKYYGSAQELAELKLIRAFQTQINSRTKMYATKYSGEQAADPLIQGELRQLSGRQAKLQDMVHKIATGANQ